MHPPWAGCQVRGRPVPAHRMPGRSGRLGQAVVEYAIAFPVILLFTLIIIQLAHIFVARQVIDYASFAAARAAIVDEDYEAAAALVCSPITGTTGVGRGSAFNLPGWGAVPKSFASTVKTETLLVSGGDAESPAVTVEVAHDFELRVPIANALTYHLGDVALTLEGLDRSGYGVPHLRMRTRTTLSRPWSEWEAEP